MSEFFHLKSVERLTELAKEPYDLTREGAVTPQRIHQMVVEGGGFKLFYPMERVSEEIEEALASLAEERHVLKQMSDMQSGEIVNKIEGYESERRPALHTAMRDFFEHPHSAQKAKAATELACRECDKLRVFLADIEKLDQFTDIIQIGIGGSELGPKAVYLGLEAFCKPNRRVHFISNVDPDDTARVFRQVDLKKTLVVVVSKSGTTIETLTNEQFAREKFQKAGLSPKEHFIAVTGEGSPMDDPQHYLASFYMWDYIGGRYSVTSMVGGVILAFALGIDQWIEFLRGANTMDRIALKVDIKSNLPLFSALLGVWNRNFLSLPTVAIIPYAQALSRFPAHLQQLDMESNGKRVNKHGNEVDYHTGPIIWGEPGTNGQHSFYQSIHQGTTIVPLEFIGFKENQYRDDFVFKNTSCQEKLLSNLFAQSIALGIGQKSDNPNRLFPGNRPNRILFADRLDPFSMGALLAYYEHKVAFQGFLWNINSFDQEGVQLGKKLASKVTEQFASARQGKAIDPKDFPLGAAYLRHITSLD